MDENANKMRLEALKNMSPGARGRLVALELLEDQMAREVQIISEAPGDDIKPAKHGKKPKTYTPPHKKRRGRF